MDVTLDLRDGSWRQVYSTGDSSAPPSPSGTTSPVVCTTGTQAPAATVCFTIRVGSPSPQGIMVSKTTDSNRGFCRPNDCSLREAVALADSYDTIYLPGTPNTYELTLPYWAIDQDLLPTILIGPHLRIRQRPLDIIGQPNGGQTVVIRQTQGDTRVFDVHGGALLRLWNVTLTGGGAGDNSTAFPSHIHGGAIHNHGNTELIGVTITGNRATTTDLPSVGGGGGIYNAATGEVRLTNVTIAGNVSMRSASGILLGGGISGPGAYFIRNTIIANNTVEGATTTSSNCGQGTAMNITNEGGNFQFPGNDCGRWVTWNSPFGNRPPITFWRSSLLTSSTNPLAPLDAQRLIFPPAPGGVAVDAGVPNCRQWGDGLGVAGEIDGNGDGVARCDSGAIELVP